jgi:methyltransferase (TIGR00027 family)
MKPGKPSVTARFVAHTRAGLERPEIPTGDAAAELRLYRSLGSTPFPESKNFHDRMERRTRFFDRLTLAAIEGGGTQVVIVGAGYDGRPVRFASPGVTWFEVDHPSTQSDKRARLLDAGADVSAIRFVAIDLTVGDLGAALEAAGHDPARPSLFLVEGLLGYLPRSVADRVLRALRHCATPGSRIAAAFPVAPKGTSTTYRFRHWTRQRLVAAIGEPWVNVYTSAEVDESFAACGWATTVFHDSPQRYEGPAGVLIVGEPSDTVPPALPPAVPPAPVRTQ